MEKYSRKYYNISRFLQMAEINDFEISFVQTYGEGLIERIFKNLDFSTFEANWYNQIITWLLAHSPHGINEIKCFARRRQEAFIANYRITVLLSSAPFRADTFKNCWCRKKVITNNLSRYVLWDNLQYVIALSQICLTLNRKILSIT